MLALLLLPLIVQGFVLSLDEFVFHRRRGLPRWERLGHPLDTLSAALCYLWLVLVPSSRPNALGVYVALCLFSCLFITKDEFVHARACEPFETWLHAVLFVLHPIVFVAMAAIWRPGDHPWVLSGALSATLGLLVYQFLYWNWRRAPAPGKLEEG